MFVTTPKRSPALRTARYRLRLSELRTNRVICEFADRVAHAATTSMQSKSNQRSRQLASCFTAICRKPAATNSPAAAGEVRVSHQFLTAALGHRTAQMPRKIYPSSYNDTW